MSDTIPCVSLAMPVFNGEHFISQAIESILQQSFADFELIVTDNASQDATRGIVEEFCASDKRVIYYRNEKNFGAAENYNIGFSLARGKYFKWCAHDDFIGKNCLALLVQELESSRDVGLAFGETVSVGPSNELIPMVGNEMPSIDENDPASRFVSSLSKSGHCFPIFGLFRSELLRKSYLHRKYYGSDRALIVELCVMAKAIKVPGAVMYNREHPLRSINISSASERRKWQGARKYAWFVSDEIRYRIQILEIILKQPDILLRVWLLARLTAHYVRWEKWKNYRTSASRSPG